MKTNILQISCEIFFPAWKEGSSGNYWHGLNRQTWDLGGDTVFWQSVDSSYLPLLPLLDWARAEFAMNLIVHGLAFMETHINYSWSFRLSTVYSFVPVLHAYLQTLIQAHRIYMFRKQIFMGALRWGAGSVSICCFRSKLYWSSSVYLAHTVIVLRSNNTTTAAGRSCSHCSHFPSVEGNNVRPRGLFLARRCGACGFLLFWEGAVPHPLLAQSPTRRSVSKARRRDVSFEENCLSVWRATHAIHFHMALQIIWPCWEPTEIKPRVFNYFFLCLIIFNLFYRCPLAFHHPRGSNTQAKNNTYQTTLSNIWEQTEG